METTKQAIQVNKKEESMNKWATRENGRIIFHHKTTPKPKDSINDFKRNESVTIFHIRTQHVPLNSHLRRIGVTQDCSCSLCPFPDETVEHHLFECPALDDLRAEHLFIQHPHFSSLAPSANHLQINQRILSRQKSNGMNVITSGGRSLTQQICL